MITVTDFDDLWVAMDESGDRYFAAILPVGTKFYRELFYEKVLGAFNEG